MYFFVFVWPPFLRIYLYNLAGGEVEGLEVLQGCQLVPAHLPDRVASQDQDHQVLGVREGLIKNQDH